MLIDVKSLEMAAADRGIEMSMLVKTVEDALLKAYLRIPGAVRGARAQIDLDANTVTIWAPEKDEDGQITGEEFDDTPSNFTRIATSTVKQVITARLRDADDAKVLGDYHHRVGKLVHGVVEFVRDKGGVSVILGNELKAVLPIQEQVPTEKIVPGQSIRAVLLEANRGPRGPHLVLSRTHPSLVKLLFEMNCPEVADGDVEIVAVAREAGHRSKIAVRSLTPGVKAKTACIGEMGARVRAVVNEIQGEKIDIVDWYKDPAQFVAAAISPAQALSVTVVDEQERQVRALVERDKLSLAIGKEGQNARLAARLTGWKIDIRPAGDEDTPVTLSIDTDDSVDENE